MYRACLWGELYENVLLSLGAAPSLWRNPRLNQDQGPANSHWDEGDTVKLTSGMHTLSLLTSLKKIISSAIVFAIIFFSSILLLLKMLGIPPEWAIGVETLIKYVYRNSSQLLENWQCKPRLPLHTISARMSYTYLLAYFFFLCDILRPWGDSTKKILQRRETKTKDVLWCHFKEYEYCRLLVCAFQINGILMHKF